jgi:crossover junction endodeoxyribonuclease RuvC
MRVMGIDPGAKGGVALISDEGVEIYEVPHITYKKTPKSQNTSEVDPRPYFKLIHRLKPDVVFIEAVGGYSGQAASRSFTFGHATGSNESIAKLVCRDVRRVNTRDWNLAAGVPWGLGKDTKKKLALRIARLAFPQIAEDLKLEKDVDKAEALLIAEYGLSLLGLPPRAVARDEVEALGNAYILAAPPKKPRKKAVRKKKTPKTKGTPEET